jgi:hypothetical protein
MPSALFITTVNITLEAFLLPFADHLRVQGWQVDAVANGATSNECIAEHFDERFDIGWSRNPLSPRNLVAPHVACATSSLGAAMTSSESKKRTPLTMNRGARSRAG